MTDPHGARSWAGFVAGVGVAAMSAFVAGCGSKGGKDASGGPSSSAAFEGPEPELIWDNVKGKRMGRRLPISQQTATAIRDWQRTRANVRIAEPSTDYLFPARVSMAPLPYLRTQTLADVLRHWAMWINDNVVGPLGQTRPLEGISLYAYAFRHSETVKLRV